MIIIKIDKSKLVEKEINNIDDFFCFNDLVIKNLQCKSWYSFPTKNEFQKLLNNKEAKIWGYYDQNTLVGVTTSFKCYEKDLVEYNLENLDYTKCIDQGVTAVHPDYTGNKLQNYMTTLFFERHKNEYDYYYCIATVHPENKYSLKNLLELGYKIVTLKNVSYGKRYIMLKKLN